MKVALHTINQTYFQNWELLPVYITRTCIHTYQPLKVKNLQYTYFRPIIICSPVFIGNKFHNFSGKYCCPWQQLLIQGDNSTNPKLLDFTDKNVNNKARPVIWWHSRLLAWNVKRKDFKTEKVTSLTAAFGKGCSLQSYVIKLSE